MTFSVTAGDAPEEKRGNRPSPARIQLAAIKKLFLRIESPRLAELTIKFGPPGNSTACGARSFLPLRLNVNRLLPQDSGLVDPPPCLRFAPALAAGSRRSRKSTFNS